MDSSPQQNSDCDKLLNDHTFSCSVEGEKCLSPAQDSCIDAKTLYCTCESGQFSCEVPSPNGCTTPACPPPDQVKAGDPCSAGELHCPTDFPVTGCDGNVAGYEECSCDFTGMFTCTAPPMPPCAMDAGATGG